MHDHDHAHPHEADSGESPSLDRNLAFSVGLNAFIVVVEVVGGLVSASLALLCDALHNLSDVVALALAPVARKLGRRPNSAKYTYGWGLLWDSVRILLEGTPPGLELAALQRDVQEHFPIRDLHHVHVWELNAGRRVLSAHVRMTAMPLAEAETLLSRIREHLAHDWAIAHATLEPEVNGCGTTELIAPRSSQNEFQTESPKP